jgi:hypothetical protein
LDLKETYTSIINKHWKPTTAERNFYGVRTFIRPWGLSWSKVPESYSGSGVATGRAPCAGQVEETSQPKRDRLKVLLTVHHGISVQ